MPIPNDGSDNVDKLVRAGLLTASERERLDADMRTRIADLTDDEISALLSVKARLGYPGTLAMPSDQPGLLFLIF